ncbi:rRNA biogenesis protein RRP36 [Popillia japonica]|uniref:rRNA biogenesis protein RRP36 n=1 Tax=Popillia japonica TaxID=7064 RepID=A0AAW1IYU5_POPJA
MENSDSESDNDIKNENQPEEIDVTPEEREKIKQEISTMSFEELQKLKQQIGTKVYNETIFGVHRQPKTNFKRLNKNRPREMSSKRRINIRNEITQLKKQPTFRDPRFDPLCGTFNEESFRENYKFLYDMKQKEYKQLERELEMTEDVEERRKIKYLKQRLGNQIREHEKLEKEKRKIQEEKQEIRTKLRKGEKPVFKKKSEKKLEGLIEKYEELKKSNKLQKHIEKKSKKLAAKFKKSE